MYIIITLHVALLPEVIQGFQKMKLSYAIIYGYCMLVCVTLEIIIPRKPCTVDLHFLQQ